MTAVSPISPHRKVFVFSDKGFSCLRLPLDLHETIKCRKDGSLHGWLGKVAQMAPMLKEHHFRRIEGGFDPCQIRSRKDKVVPVRDEADIVTRLQFVRIGARISSCDSANGSGDWSGSMVMLSVTHLNMAWKSWL